MIWLKLPVLKLEDIIDTFFPPRCFCCQDNTGHICQACLAKCQVSRYCYCLVCDKKSSMGETHAGCMQKGVPLSIYSAFEYQGSVRDCILRAKYKGKLFAPLKVLSRKAAALAVSCGISHQDYIVVPIPLSVKRAKERGFNQAGYIAQALAERFSLKCNESVLIRNRETKAQYDRTRQERFKNLAGAFLVKGSLRGKKILLVDDICTTGATLLEASKVLYQAGALEVRCFTLAKEF